MFGRLSIRIFLAVLLPVILAIVLLDFFFQKELEHSLIQDIERGLAEKTALLTPRVFSKLNSKELKLLKREVDRVGKASQTRITIILKDGTVLADSEKNPNLLDNHRDRPEVLQALAQGTGESRRYSESTQQEMIYFAHMLKDQENEIGILRLSFPVSILETRAKHFRSMFVPLYLALICFALFVGLWISTYVTRPIELLKQVAEEIPAGKKVHGVPLRRRDLIGELGHSISEAAEAMTTQVQQARREQSHLDAMLSAMTEGILAVDMENKILVCNPASRKMLKIQGVKIEDKYIEEVTDVSSIVDIIEETKAKKEIAQREFEIRHEGEELSVIAQGRHFDSESGSGIIIALHDVTRTRYLERIRKDFVENASHELRTPLTAIKGFVEALTQDPKIEKETRKRFFEKIVKNVNHLTRLAKDLLDLSKIENRKPSDLSPQKVDCNQIADEVFERQKVSAEKRRIQLQIEGNRDHVVWAWAEPASVAEVLDNLVENALRYTEPGGQVTIQTAQEGDWARIDVRDSGIGIPAEEQDRIFERFYRVDKARSANLGGTGLGLSIVKHLISQMNGKISVKSQPGKGSLFRVELPRTA